MRIVDTGLLRNANIGDLHTRRPVDLDQRRKRLNRSGQCRVVRTRQGAGRNGGLCSSDAAVRIYIQQLTVEWRVLVLRDIVGEIVGNIAGWLPPDRGTKTMAIKIVESGLTGQRVLRCCTLILDDTVELDAEIMIFGKVEMKLTGVRAIIAISGADATTEFAARCLGDDRKGTAFGVAAGAGVV